MVALTSLAGAELILWHERMSVYRNSLTKVAGRLAGTTAILALVLAGVGTAGADEFEAPTNIQNTSLMPGCLSVSWQHSSSGVSNYTVKLDGEEPKAVPDPQQFTKEFCSLEPGSTHRVEVCAVFGTDDADKACTTVENLKTVASGVGEMVPGPPRGTLPVPPIKPILGPGTTEFGVEWGWRGTSGGHNYDYYNIAVAPGVGKLKHDADGNWGWQLITNLTPNTTYTVMVEGCDIDPIPYTNDDCSGWSPPATVTTKSDLPYGPDTCKSGFVWREAFNGDTVCVDPARRQKVADDNNLTSSRRPSTWGKPPVGDCLPLTARVGDPPKPCPPAVLFTCNPGFVWRGARQDDYVCVEPRERDLVAQENATANERRAQPR